MARRPARLVFCLAFVLSCSDDGAVAGDGDSDTVGTGTDTTGTASDGSSEGTQGSTGSGTAATGTGTAGSGTGTGTAGSGTGSGTTTGTDTGSGTDTGPYGLVGMVPELVDDEWDLSLDGATDLVLPFVWTRAAGWPPEIDFAIHTADGTPFAQIFTADDRPMVRLGLDVAPLEADTEYELRVAIDRPGGRLLTTVVERASGEVVARGNTTVYDDGGLRDFVLRAPTPDLRARHVKLGDPQLR